MLTQHVSRSNSYKDIGLFTIGTLLKLSVLHYFMGLTWERVAVETNYSIVWVWQMHGRILEKMRKEISPG